MDKKKKKRKGNLELRAGFSDLPHKRISQPHSTMTSCDLNESET